MSDLAILLNAKDREIDLLRTEIERLRELCRDISDTVNTSPYLWQQNGSNEEELANIWVAIRKIEDLAVSGYAHVLR